MTASTLPRLERVLVVCAHPDDESFGLGAVLSTLTDTGTRIDLLCFTHGEASTLRIGADSLAAVRADELARAGDVLGVAHLELLDYPDGALADWPLDELADHVRRTAEEVDPSVLLVFDHGGITGHPDHQRATDAALAAAPGLGVPVLAWAVPERIACTLNREYGTTFAGRGEDELDVTLVVERSRQLEAIRQHRSQSTDNPVLWRRLELTGPVEHLRYLA